MIWLSFFVCLNASDACRIVPFEGAFRGISECQHQGMLISPHWEEMNRPWHVRRVRCSSDKPSESQT
jgi:hypothetical protein